MHKTMSLLDNSQHQAEMEKARISVGKSLAQLGGYLKQLKETANSSGSVRRKANITDKTVLTEDDFNQFEVSVREALISKQTPRDTAYIPRASYKNIPTSKPVVNAVGSPPKKGRLQNLSNNYK